MKRLIAVNVPVFVIAILAMMCVLPLAYGKAQSGFQPDVVVRIARIEQALNVIDELSLPAAQSSGQPASATLRAMLMGTQWIDGDRSVVIGLAFDAEQMEKQPDMAALVPFAQPNPNFAAAYGATQKDDFYLLPLPMGNTEPVRPELTAALVEASKKPVQRFVSVDVAASRMVDKAEPKIQQFLTLMEQKMAEAPQTTPDTAMLEQAGTVMDELINICRQMETLSFGLELGQQDVAFFMSLLAMADSEIAGLMSPKADASAGRLGNIVPGEDLHMQFRTRPYDIAEATGFLADHFGGFYKTMGIDLEQALPMVSHFTGETVGAMSIDPSGVVLEMVAAVNTEQPLPEDFLENEYIPWLVETGEQMARFYKEQRPDLEMDSVFVKAPGSTVAGQKVVGVEARLPVIDPSAAEIPVLRLPIRMARVNDCLVAASDDTRMEPLIRSVSDFEPAPAEGPLMRMTMDWTGLMKAAVAMDPQQGGQMLDSIPELGDLVYTVELQERRMQAKYAMKREDIKQFVESMAAIQSKAGQSSGLQAPSGQPENKANRRPGQAKTGTVTAAGQPEQETPEAAKSGTQQQSGQELTEDDAQYWMDKGGLYASYGNPDAAIKSFQKALKLDPENIRATFNLGLAYAEKGDYQKALEHINQAVAAAPENGNYLYGHGWVHLLSGNGEKAMESISRAASLGNPDAIEYMNSIAPRHRRK